MKSRVYSVTSLTLLIEESMPPGLRIHVEGETVNPHWSNIELSYFVYINPPADGIYEADVIGTPSDIGPDVLSPFRIDASRRLFPDDLKGLKVYSATNSVTAMLP